VGLFVADKARHVLAALPCTAGVVEQAIFPYLVKKIYICITTWTVRRMSLIQNRLIIATTIVDPSQLSCINDSVPGSLCSSIVF